MTIDPSWLNTIMLALGSLLVYAANQSKQRARSQRKREKYLVKKNQLQLRYIYRLEQGYAERDLQLPDPPPGYPMEDDEDEH